MPLSPKWKVPGTRVITPIGYGAIGGRLCAGKIEVRLDQPWASEAEVFQNPGEIVLDTDFTLLRILNVTGVGIVTSAVNYPTWEEVADLALFWPFVQDETLIGLNFATREAVCARIWNHLGDYHQIEAGYDRHTKIIPWVSESQEEAIQVWEAQMGPLSGTSGHLLLAILLVFEDDETRILARKLLGTTMVLKDERYFQ